MYEIFEHTADLGLRIRANDLPGLFEEAARALFSTMVMDSGTIRSQQETTFHLEGDRHDDLLRDWLGELLYTFHADRMLYAEFDVRLEGTRMAAKARV